MQAMQACRPKPHGVQGAMRPAAPPPLPSSPCPRPAGGQPPQRPPLVPASAAPRAPAARARAAAAPPPAAAAASAAQAPPQQGAPAGPPGLDLDDGDGEGQLSEEDAFVLSRQLLVKISVARGSGRLDLADMGLRSLPEEVLELEDLEV
jgi:hypothetical protein